MAGPDYAAKRQLRSSFTTFFGPPTWHLFHVAAERAARAATSTPQLEAGLVAAVGRLIAQIAPVLPGPYCRTHLLERVGHKDVTRGSPSTEPLPRAETVACVEGCQPVPTCESEHGPAANTSETRLYPLPYLTFGGSSRASSLHRSGHEMLPVLADLRTARGADLRLWISALHNAVTSSVTSGRHCSVSEGHDEKFDCGVLKKNLDGPQRELGATTWYNAPTITNESLSFHADRLELHRLIGEIYAWLRYGSMHELNVESLLHTGGADLDRVRDTYLVRRTMGSWPLANRWEGLLGAAGSWRRAREAASGWVLHLRASDGDEIRTALWAGNMSDAGLVEKVDAIWATVQQLGTGLDKAGVFEQYHVREAAFLAATAAPSLSAAGDEPRWVETAGLSEAKAPGLITTLATPAQV